MKNNNILNNQQTSENKTQIIITEQVKEAKVVVLKPIGYPFTSAIIETPQLEVENKELFELYAQDQWNGYLIKEGHYIFDQKILPDYAFQIVNAHPNNSKITNNTSILLIENQENTKNTYNKIETDITLNDVVGQKQAKTKCKIITKYLEDPEKFNEWAPKNILFYGTPGTGKTMLAKALSNEIDAPLFLVKATNLIGDHVGDGARQIHELFETAAQKTPSIIFIDEIDAIALDRSYQSLRGDVSEVVNALLTELDGIKLNKGVVTIAATNNPQLLDYAIRSRFEEEIQFINPNEEERKQIIENNIKTMPLPVEVNCEKLAKISKGMSGRDLKEKLLKSALHKAISEDKPKVTKEDIDYALKNYESKKDEPKGMFV